MILAQAPLVLNSHRIVLTHPPTEADDEGVFELFSDPRALRFLPFFSSLSPEQVVERRITRNAHPTKINFVVRSEEGSFLGITGFPDYDEINKSAEVGIIFNAQSQRTGAATISLFLLLEFGFNPAPHGLGLHRAFFRTGENNVQMRGWLESVLGIEKEGTFREAWKSGDGWLDCLCYAILEDEWRGGLKDRLQQRIESRRAI